MIISLVAAASENNVIGKNNWMPWDLPAELAHFRAYTRGKTVIMGRKTYDSVGRPMPNRHNIVITQQNLTIPGVDVVHSIEDALELAKKDGLEEICVIGGGSVYKAALPYANRIHLSRIHTTIEGGEAFFPDIDWSQWQEVSRAEHPADAENAIPYTMLVYERK
nr:Dihydrofolate reductase [uncultured bacterium]